MCPARLTKDQKVSIELQLKDGGHASETVWEFKLQYHTNRTLVPSTVSKVVAKFLEHGSVENRWNGHYGLRVAVRIAANIDLIQNQMRADPTTSIQCLEAQTAISRS